MQNFAEILDYKSITSVGNIVDGVILTKVLDKEQDVMSRFQTLVDIITMFNMFHLKRPVLSQRERSKKNIQNSLILNHYQRWPKYINGVVQNYFGGQWHNDPI